MERGAVPLIGVVGGIASGKSFVAEQLRRLGAAVISADQLGHDVLKLDEIKQRCRQRWGDAIFAGDQIDRAALGRIVFAPPPDGPQELKILEQWTHPKIGELLVQQVTALASQPGTRAIVLDVPLMFEAGWNKFCDRIIFVDAPRALREARASSRGWTREEFARREAAQESLETKRKLADVVIDNSGSPESVAAQIEQLWHSLVGSSPPS